VARLDPSIHSAKLMLQRATNSRARRTSVEVFPAPSKGWVQSGNIVTASRDQAEVLDNLWPTSQGARLRGGFSEFADCEEAITRLFVYSSGTDSVMFAAGANDIFNTTAPTVSVRGSLTNGDWSTTQISTAGGVFLVGANGADSVFNFNGASFSTPTINNVSSADLSQVWLFKERLFFVEKNTQSAWYLPTQSIAGDATEIPLGSVFRNGGALLFGATWSLDSGSGLDDVCLFVSTNGEIAVYEGNDPSSASSWSLVGVYEIGRPIDKHSFFKAGGDLAIVTEDGIIPVSEALRKDRAALQATAITYPIEDAWKAAIAKGTGTRPISAVLWQSQTLLMVSTSETEGGLPVAFTANARTGAWARTTGWDIQCQVVFNDQLYFADAAGVIYAADTGGTDNGMAYRAIYVPKFSNSGSLRSAHSVGITYESSASLVYDLDIQADYQVSNLSTPAATNAYAGDVWGAGVWGTFVWGAGAVPETFTEWQFGTAVGYALAPSLTMTSNQVALIPFKILSTRIRFETGSEM
jgi:hypothetical protein